MATHSSILAWRIPMDRGYMAGYSLWSRKEQDMTEQLNNHHLQDQDSRCDIISS